CPATRCRTATARRPAAGHASRVAACRRSCAARPELQAQPVEQTAQLAAAGIDALAILAEQQALELGEPFADLLALLAEGLAPGPLQARQQGAVGQAVARVHLQRLQPLVAGGAGGLVE